MSVTESDVRELLRQIPDPCSLSAGCPISIEEMGLITAVTVDEDGTVAVKMRLTSPGCWFGPLFQREIRKKVGALAGVSQVTVAVIKDWMWSEADISDVARQRLADTRKIRSDKMLVQIGRKGIARAPSS